MRRVKKAITGILIVFSLTSLLSCVYRPAPLVNIGTAAPAFKLPDLGGQEVALEQFKGKVVLLDIWATWCGPCRMTMPVVEKLAKEYPDDLVLLAINLQEPKSVVEKYVYEQALHSRILLDETGAVGAAYGADAIPLQFLLDRNGIVRHIQAGYSDRMAAELRAQIEQLR